jgi:hypothetical protein
VANNVWIGDQTARAKIVTVTVSSAVAAETFTLTTGTGKSISYTAGGAETTTTIAAALLVLAAAMQTSEGDWAELTFSTNTANVFTVTGPTDGAPFTFTAGGTGTMTATETTAPLSPHDAADTANYSTGALPVDTVDALIFENSAVDVRYNLAALAALGLTSLTRRTSYTGRIGLPDTNAAGYVEFRAKELSVKVATIQWEQSGADGFQQHRLLNVDTGGATTLTVVGDGTTPEVGSEALEFRGSPASSVVNVTGGSVRLAPYVGQACTVLTLRALYSTVSSGPSMTFSGTLDLKDCQARILSSWTTSLTVKGPTSEVEVAGAAAGVVMIEAGRILWKSTGAIGASPIVGSAGTLDVSQAPTALTPSGTVQLYAGSTVDDSAGRYGNWAFKLNHCTLAEVNVVTPDDKTLTFS